MSTKEMVAELERLDEAALTQFVDELEQRVELAEDLYDLLAFRMRAHEPVRPFDEFVAELETKR